MTAAKKTLWATRVRPGDVIQVGDIVVFVQPGGGTNKANLLFEVPASTRIIKSVEKGQTDEPRKATQEF